jgi:CRP/FNR family transcriptional regulator, cyclic AMP receptor protein
MKPAAHWTHHDLYAHWQECIWADCVPAQVMQTEVLPQLRVHCYQPGQMLWQRGDAPTAWVGVMGGAAKMCLTTAEGRSVTVGCTAGSWMGEAPLILGAAQHSCDAVALHTLSAVSMPRTCFDRLRRTYLPFALFLQELMAERNQQLMDLLAAQQESNTPNKVAKCLSALLTPRNFPTPLSREIQVSQGELSELCQVSRSRLSEALTELEARGMIHVGYRRIRVLDWESMRAVC